MLRVKHWSRPAYALLAILMIAAFCLNVLPLPIPFSGAGVASATTETFTTAGTFYWICPTGVTIVTVEVWGGGGGGGLADQTTHGAAGGGGGAYSKITDYAVSPGGNYTYVVGNYGAGGDGDTYGFGDVGGQSYFGNTSTVQAGGGGGAGPPSYNHTGGTGGTVGAGTGYSGGVGGVAATSKSGGGGEGAGTSATGGAGTSALPGLGGSGTDGGNGGNGGGSAQGPGLSGTAPGGGGGGGYKISAHQNGGIGAVGQVKLTYTVTPPTISTLAATSITTTSATLNGNVTSLGAYGNVTSYGFVLSTSTQSNPGNVSPSAQTTYTAGNWTWTGVQYAAGQVFDSNGNVTGLTSGVTYYFRAAGYSSYGWVYGDEKSFTTLSGIPSIVTIAATSITTSSATLNGNVTSLNGGGNVTSYGFVLSTSTQSNPGNVSPSAQTTYTAGNWTWAGVQYAAGQVFDSNGNVTGLTSGVTYYFRAAGYSSYGWGYGDEKIFPFHVLASGGISNLKARFPAQRYVGTYDRVYFAWISSASLGTLWINYYDNASKTLGTPAVLTTGVGADIHASPVVFVISSGAYAGYILVACSDRAIADFPLLVYRSPSPETISGSWSGIPFWTEYSHYPQFVQLGNGSVALFDMYSADAAATYGTRYRITSDGGQSYGAAVTLLTPAAGFTYPSVVAKGNAVHIVYNLGGVGGYRNVYYAYSPDNMATWRTQGNATSITLPIDVGESETVDTGTDWVFDIQVDGSGSPVISFTTYVNATTALAKWVNYAAGWQVHSTGVNTLVYDTYFWSVNTGIFIDPYDTTHVYIGVRTGATTSDIQEWYTTNLGATWAKVTDITASSTAIYDEPRPIVNYSTGGLKLIFNYITSYTSFAVWTSSLIGCVAIGTIPDISNTPSSKAFSIVQPSQTYWANAGEKILSQLIVEYPSILYSGYRSRVGERLNSWPACTISSIDLDLFKFLLPTGTAYVRVRAVSDDSILGTLGSIDVSTLTTSQVWYTFNTPVTVPSTQDIRIMVEYNGGNSTNSVSSMEKTADVYAGGVRAIYDGNYTDVSGVEFVWRNLTYTSAEPSWPLSAGDCWGNLTNNSSFAVNILASMGNMTGGTTWSIGSSPGTNVFTIKIGVAGLAGVGNFTTLSNTPVAWIASMAAGNMTRWVFVFYTPTNSPQFADGVPKSGNMTFEAEAS